jgi:glycine/D-amino acid oxidase-like deaminating enzyme
MSAKEIDTTPYWTTSATFPQFAKLTEDASADVAVVGAGVTGLTTAYLLAKNGKRVVVLERGRCAMTDTGHTSAHLTMVTDARLTELVTRFGRDHAQAVWDAGLAAIATIERVVRITTRVGRRIIGCCSEVAIGWRGRVSDPGRSSPPRDASSARISRHNSLRWRASRCRSRGRDCLR